MDERLVAWGRAVKSRRRGQFPPPLWLFTDAARMPDLARAVRRLPKGLCGVVFRHDGVAGRAALARNVALLCRARRLAMVVAGAPVPLPGVGRHLRSGRGVAGGVCTASAHGRADLVRGRRAGAACLVLSPVFPTASHPGAAALGVLRWAALARRAGRPVLALGGVDGRTVRRLPRWAAGAAAIGAMI